MPLGSLNTGMKKKGALEAVAGGIPHPKRLTEFMKKRERDYSKEGISPSSIGSIWV